MVIRAATEQPREAPQMSRNVVQVSCLGSLGRFGNQLFQYAFARAYAEHYDAVLETPQWIGQSLFELDDPPISRHCPPTAIDDVPWGEVNIDLRGWFQFPSCTMLLSRTTLRQWFQFRPEAIVNLRLPPEHLVCHLRRGDYVASESNHFCLIPHYSYIRACMVQGFHIGSIRWISEDLGRHYLTDFLAMMDAQVLLRANSTFSWWAATLGTARVLSPKVGTRVGWHDVEFIDGNTPAVCDGSNLSVGKSGDLPILP